MSAPVVSELKWNKGTLLNLWLPCRGGGKATVIAAESSLAILSVHVQQQLLLQTMTLSDLHLKGQEGGGAS